MPATWVQNLLEGLHCRSPWVCQLSHSRLMRHSLPAGRRVNVLRGRLRCEVSHPPPMPPSLLALGASQTRSSSTGREKETTPRARAPWAGTRSLSPSESMGPCSSGGGAAIRTPGVLIHQMYIFRGPEGFVLWLGGRGRRRCVMGPRTTGRESIWCQETTKLRFWEGCRLKKFSSFFPSPPMSGRLLSLFPSPPLPCR